MISLKMPLQCFILIKSFDMLIKTDSDWTKNNERQYTGAVSSKTVDHRCGMAKFPELSRTLTEDIDIEQSKSVVELGPGTGAVTGFILESIAADAKFFAVELNSSVINPFRRRYPHVKLYNDSAVNLKK
jgi:predicted O-methyltransferase YrrM